LIGGRMTMDRQLEEDYLAPVCRPEIIGRNIHGGSHPQMDATKRCASWKKREEDNARHQELTVGYLNGFSPLRRRSPSSQIFKTSS